MLQLGLISEADYDEIKRTTRPDVFRQEYECEFISFTGATYNELIPAHHITHRIPAPETWQRVLLSIDWGFTHATCVLFAYIRDGYICVFDEVYGTKMLLSDVYDRIRERCEAWNIQNVAAVADHDPKSIEELNQRGIPCGNADKVNVLGNRLQVKELLFRNRLLIHPRCEMLIRDLQAATWDPKKPEDIDYSQCSWGHFDAEAALRYLIREYSGFEAERPTELPRLHDAVSAAAWKLEYLNRGVA
jgi:phage terminase large subunit